MRMIVGALVCMLAGMVIEALIRVAGETLRRGRARCSELAAEARGIVEDIEPEGRDEIMAVERAKYALENLAAVMAKGEEATDCADLRGSRKVAKA